MKENQTVQVRSRYDCCLTDEGIIQILDTRRPRRLVANWVQVQVRGRGSVVEVVNVDTGTRHICRRRHRPGESYFTCDCEAALRGCPNCYHRAAAEAVALA